jgi:hypothetical protein
MESSSSEATEITVAEADTSAAGATEEPAALVIGLSGNDFAFGTRGASALVSERSVSNLNLRGSRFRFIIKGVKGLWSL